MNFLSSASPLYTRVSQVESDSGEDNGVILNKSGGERMLSKCTVKRLANVVATRQRNSTGRMWKWLLTILLILLLAAIMLSILIFNRTWDFSKAPGHATPSWNISYNGIGSESCVRLVDVDEDGLLDIIYGMAPKIGMKPTETKFTMEEECLAHGLTYPCKGLLVAIKGTTGQFLWQINLRANIFELNCGSLDVDLDGKLDCLAAGRASTLVAVDPRKGKIIWTHQPIKMYDLWNIYCPLVVDDLDSDGVADLVVMIGGDPAIPSPDPNRKSGQVIISSGRTGAMIGTHMLELPENRESYMSPVAYRQKDGTVYVFLGSGGETVSGSLFYIRLSNLFLYVTRGVASVASNPVWPGQVHPCTSTGLCELYRSVSKGVMVPPVIVDITNDGIDDVVVSAYDGTLLLYDGRNLSVLWKISFPGYESYSSPAPGYFNDDDTLDLMASWNFGAWPKYTHGMAIAFDGRDGSVLWSQYFQGAVTSSSLVIATTQPRRSVFAVTMIGRTGKKPERVGSIYHGIAAQRPIEERSLHGDPSGSRGHGARPRFRDYSGQREGQKDYNESPLGGALRYKGKANWGSSVGSQDNYQDIIRDIIQDFKVEGKTKSGRNQVDPDVPDATGGITSGLDGLGKTQLNPATSQYPQTYNEEHDEDETSVKDKQKVPKSHCSSNLEFYREEIFLIDRTNFNHPLLLDKSDAFNQTYELEGNYTEKMFSCAVLRPNGYFTGSFADVDGDGELDFVKPTTFSANYNNNRHYAVRLAKINMKEVMMKKEFVTMNRKSASKLPPNIKFSFTEQPAKVPIDRISFLPDNLQFWNAYMGPKSDSHYYKY